MNTETSEIRSIKADGKGKCEIGGDLGYVVGRLDIDKKNEIENLEQRYL